MNQTNSFLQDVAKQLTITQSTFNYSSNEQETTILKDQAINSRSKIFAWGSNNKGQLSLD